MARNAGARLDPIFQFAQIQAQHVGPDQPRRMIGTDQAVKARHAKLNLPPLRLRHAGRSRGFLPRRFDLLRQLAKQTVPAHRNPPLGRISFDIESDHWFAINDESQGGPWQLQKNHKL